MISARVIQDSISEAGIRITTMELVYPRFIHSEFMTHRMLSRNAASSRAIPIEKMIETIENNPAIPVHWGKNQAGMQAKEELEDFKLWQAQHIWLAAAKDAIDHSRNMANLGVHKQIANRITEPFQWMKVVVTATDWENFFWLRDHEDAQPEIRALAVEMRKAMNASEPFLLYEGEWHVPYVNRMRGNVFGEVMYYTGQDDGHCVKITYHTPEEARMISASCCAQVSYRKNDDSLEKAKIVFDRLINSEPVHASPVEHQATPMGEDASIEDTDGVTHDRVFYEYEGAFAKSVKVQGYSNNFRGWIQYRALIPNNVKQ